MVILFPRLVYLANIAYHCDRVFMNHVSGHATYRMISIVTRHNPRLTVE